MIARAKLLIIALLAGTATCATSSASPPVMRSSRASGDAGIEELSEAGLPDLCSLSGGRWCTPCGGPGEPACPQGDSGALCCQAGVCVVWTGGDCAGDLGWCSNYTTKTGPSGIEEATCWD